MNDDKLVPASCSACGAVTMIEWRLIVETGCNMAITCQNCDATTWYPTGNGWRSESQDRPDPCPQ